MQSGSARTSGLGVLPLLYPLWVAWAVPVRPIHGVWFVFSGHSATLRAHLCALSWATWLLYTGVLTRCVGLLVRCPGPLGSCSQVCQLVALCGVCGVLGHSAPVYWCARSVRCVACAVSWATSLLFTGAPARCVVLRVRRPGRLCSYSPVRRRGVLCCVSGVPGHSAPVHRFARSVRCLVCAMSWATWLLFIGVSAWCVV